MKTYALVAAVLLAASGAGPAPARAQYQLVWSDDFNGSTLDPAKWEAQIGTGCPSLCGWGNNELQSYQSENAVVSGGFLIITAKEEVVTGAAYTSARLRTKDLGDWKHGRFEMRARLPIGQGLWPAFWMLPTDEDYGIWAASGEIDIMEYVGQTPSQVFGTLHYGGTAPANTQSPSKFYTLPGPGDFSTGFHDFALEWDECEMRWYVDGTLSGTERSWYSEGGPYPAPFDQRFHLLLNLAVGGNLPGPPDGSTSFPQSMVVDYVRVYQLPDVDLQPCTLVFDGMNHANPFGNGWFQFGGTVGGGGIGPDFVDLPPVDGCNASLASGWGSAGTPGFFGGFGRTNRLDLTGQTHFSFWINPDAGQDYTLEINLQDDDNGDDQFPSVPDGLDDEFQYSAVISPTGPDAISGGGWQLVSIPLTSFADDNSYHYGGNGILDAVPTGSGGNGRLVNIVITVIGNTGSDATFRTDEWNFEARGSSVAGRLWHDQNGNGVQDGLEPGLDSVLMELFDPARGAVIATYLTLSDGDFSFPGLLGGDLEVRVNVATLPADLVPSYDPDGTGTPDVAAAAVPCATALTGQDFGYAPNPTAAPTVAALPGGGHRNVPNPFAPRTVIEFDLARDGAVDLGIYDVTGRRVRTLVGARRAAGAHRIEWDGTDDGGRPVSAGIYYSSLTTDEGRSVRKLTRIR